MGRTARTPERNASDAQVTRDEITKIMRDALYATVGAGVLTVQQLDQVRRQMAERLSDPRTASARSRSTSWSSRSRTQMSTSTTA